MRLFFCSAICICVHVSIAQCTISNVGLDPLQRNTEISDIRFVPGGLIAAGKPVLPDWVTVSRGLHVSRADGEGALIWFRSIQPTNPEFILSKPTLAIAQDGSVVLAGDIDHTTYINQYALKLDTAGTVEWARIYMMPDSAAGQVGYNSNGNRSHTITALNDGTFAWQILSQLEVYNVILDAAGMPVDAQAYRDEDLSFQHGVTGMSPDGSWVHAYTGDTLDLTDPYTGHFSVTAGGSVANAHRMPGDGYYSDVEPLTNGDHLLTGYSFGNSSGFTRRVSSSGDVLWQQNSWWPEQICELNDGSFIFKHASLLLHSDANGSSLESWWAGNGGWLALDERNDSIAAVREPTGPPEPLVHLSDGITGLGASCALTPQSPIAVTPGPHAFVPHAIAVDTAVIKTWAMSLIEPTNDTLDLAAFATTGPFRPGFDAYITGSAVNTSGSTSAGFTITCELPSLLTPQTIQPTPSSINGNLLSWEVPDGLSPYGYWSFLVWATVPADVELIGQQAETTVTVVHDSTEMDLSNNTYTVARTITGGYDPNDKLVRSSTGQSPFEYILGEDTWMDYTIRFQNTGNDTAFSVVVVDTLPAGSSVGSFTFLGASHAYTYELNGQGILRVSFSQILLPDSGTNLPMSQGYFSFRLRPEALPVLGSTISNSADIYFDFNPPVRTPPANLLVTAPTSIATDRATRKLFVYPDPAKDRLEVLLPEGMLARDLSIIGLDGRFISKQRTTARSTLQLDVQTLPPGMYVLIVATTDGPVLNMRFAVE